MARLPSFLSAPDPNRDELLSAKAEFDALERMQSERIDRFKRYRDEGMRVRDETLGIHAAELEDYGRRVRQPTEERHRIQLPLGKAATVKHAFRIAGRLPDVIVDERDESPQESHRSDSMEKIVWAIIRASRGETTFAGASWNASELGSCVFDLYMDFDRNMPVIRSIDPVGFYEVRGVDDPHDFQRVYRVFEAPLASVQNEYRGKTFRGVEIPVADLQAFSVSGGVEMVRIIQLCDKERLLRFAIGGDQVMGLSEYQHNYGFVPYVVIPNIGPYEDVWGWADYEFVRALGHYIQILFSREADVLAAVAAGAYQEDGTGVNTETIRKVIKQGGVVAKKRGSTIEPIQAADMPNFAEAHADRAMDLFKMLGFTPDAAWGLPGSGSGTDRGLQLQPLLEYTAMKQLNWQAGLGRLFGLCFRMIEKKMVGRATYSGVAYKGKSSTPKPFSMLFGPGVEPIQMADPNSEIGDVIDLPRTPKELFDGDYAVRFAWRNMVDPDDPAYVLSELNKFSTGVQSLETTLENLGIQAPEDEMKRIEAEAERFPWINDGRVSLLMAQLRGNAQGTGGGAPPDMSGAMGDALSSISGGAGGGAASGALDADAGAAALGSGGMGQLYGGA